MEIPNPLLLALHVAFGTAALFAGPVALASRKGGRWHKRLGLAFSASMVITGLSSLALAFQTGKSFLFGIGLFSLYLTITGFRSIQWKRLMKRGRKAKRADWIISSIMLVAGLVMLSTGIGFLVGSSTQGILWLVFGLFAAVLSLLDMRLFMGQGRKNGFWMMAHVGKMVGAVISAYTALLVVNQPDWMHPLIAWLGPTVLGAFIIAYWQKRLRQDMAKDDPELVVRSSSLMAV